MHGFSWGVTRLAAIGITGIGVMYLLQPRVMTHNFRPPFPGEGRSIVWGLRLKGSRDIIAAKDSPKSALGVHGLTAAVMILAAIPWVMGVA